MKIGAFFMARVYDLWPTFNDHRQNKADGYSRNNLYIGFLLPLENVKRKDGGGEN
jgi:hypothetical protein